MTGKKSTKEKEKIRPEETGLMGPEIKESTETAAPETDIQAEAITEEKPPEDLTEKIAELNDKYLRLFSEFDNYRKRTIKERIELSKTASAEIITSLLPVLDDFERAIKAHTGKEESTTVLDEGIILIYNKFLNILTQKGLEQMKTIGEPFNTDRHEAITNIPAPEPDRKGKVLDEVEKGYLLNGKVIRYAKVVVGS